MRLASRICFAFSAAALVLLPVRAEAIQFSFSNCYTSNGDTGVCAQVASQLKVEVMDAGGGFVDFTFTNEVGVASSLTDIYFDADGFLKNMTILDESSGVSFEIGANPANPPGAPANFSVTSGMTTDSNSPRSQNGIDDASEYLTLRFETKGSNDFDDIIAALQLGPTATSGIRIAAHVQAIGLNGQSEGMICCTGGGGGGGGGVTTPEPASLALFGIVALGMAHRLRRRTSR